MAATHLGDGHDVVVPQFLARDTFITELEAVARQSGARFIEVALVTTPEDTVRAFEARSATPENQQHIDAQQLVERSGPGDGLAEMHDRLMVFLESRPKVRRVAIVRGDIESTLRRVEAAIADGR